MMSKISTFSSNSPQLPPRQNYGSLDEVRIVAAALGHEVEATARARSSTEWAYDSWRAEEMQDALGLDDAQLLALLAALVERNRSFWGPYCQASLAPWYADMIKGVEARSQADSREERCA